MSRGGSPATADDAPVRTGRRTEPVRGLEADRTRQLPAKTAFSCRSTSSSAFLDELTGRIPDVCAWTTWHDLAHIVLTQHTRTTNTDPSTAATITRLVTSITGAVARHS